MTKDEIKDVVVQQSMSCCNQISTSPTVISRAIISYFVKLALSISSSNMAVISADQLSGGV